MKTEQDIRRFMQENRLPVPKDAEFMSDLIRQINLLPTPAALSGKDDRIQENIRMVKVVLASIKKHNRKQALILVIVNMLVSIAVFTTGNILLAPDLNANLLMGTLCLAFFAVTISFSDLVRI